jgi:hypothetical protein
MGHGGEHCELRIRVRYHGVDDLRHRGGTQHVRSETIVPAKIYGSRGPAGHLLIRRNDQQADRAPDARTQIR